MKQLSLSLLAIVAATALSFTPGASTYKADAAKSTLVWTGKKVTGSHTGNVKLATGSLSMDGDKITAGTFDIDLNSMTCTDLTDKGYNDKLIGHLKSEDFFSTAKFPKATFVLSNATSKGNGNYDVTGKLTVKGITNEVTFPVVVKTLAKSLTATAKITIDRTKFDIKYGSGSFFDNLGDKAIDNDFTIDMILVANK
jgi:polyisoprenoid-binding protein YceI